MKSVRLDHYIEVEVRKAVATSLLAAPIFLTVEPQTPSRKCYQARFEMYVTSRTNCVSC